MKRLAILVGLLFLVTSLCVALGQEQHKKQAADKSWTGYVTDEGCAAKGRGGAGHADCAEKCLSKEGTKAVLVTDGDNKVVKIANQDKVKGHAGHHVKVTGKLDGDSLTIESVSMVE